MHRKLFGYLVVIASACLFGCMPFVASIFYAGGGNAYLLTFFRFFFSIPVFALYIAFHPTLTLHIKKRQIAQIAVLAIGGSSLTAVLMFSSYLYIPSGMATTLHFVYPFFVLLGGLLFFHEKLTVSKAFCFILSAVGIVLINDSSGGGNPIGIILALCSGGTYAFYILFLDKSGLKYMHSFKLSFYISVFASVALFLFTLLTGHFTLQLTPSAWLAAVVMALGMGVGATCLFQTGIKMTGSRNASLLSTFEPVTSLVLGCVLLGDPFHVKTLLGAAGILLAVVLMLVLERRKRDPDAPEVHPPATGSSSQ